MLQHGRFLRLFSPGFTYVKFRCARCKRTNERFVSNDEWDAHWAAHPDPTEAEERPGHPDRLGPISLEEMREFRRRLHESSGLDDLLSDLD